MEGAAAECPRRRLALLAFLCAHRQRGASREKALACFWPDRDPEVARHSLAQLVYAVRQELGADVIIREPDDLRVDPDLLPSDIEDFERAIERGDAQKAVAVYVGPFLDGFSLADAPEFDRWCEEERARLVGRFATALETLATDAAHANDDAAAVTWWKRRAALDRLDVPVTLALMDALAQAGDRAGAIRQAAIHEALLRSELELPPDPQVVARAEELRRAMASSSPPTGTALLATAAHGREPVASPPPRPALPSSPTERAETASRPSGRHAAPRRFAASITVSLLLVLATGAVLLARRRDAASPRAPTLIVLGAIAGPNSSLTLAVREALRAGLEADPSLRVLGETRVRETLRLMSRPVDTPLNGPVATEIALRRGAAYAVTGSAVKVGNGWQIVAGFLDPRTDEAVMTVAEHPVSADQAVPAIARIGERLRRRASGARRGSNATPLPGVMTSSLGALQDYARARAALRRNDRDAALRYGEAALEQDSAFAMAHYLVGDLDWFVDHQRDCEVQLSDALALRDRLPLRERLQLEARYQQVVADQPDSALVLWERLHAAFPDDGQAFEGMAWTYRALGRFREAAAAAELGAATGFHQLRLERHQPAVRAAGGRRHRRRPRLRESSGTAVRVAAAAGGVRDGAHGARLAPGPRRLCRHRQRRGPAPPRAHSVPSRGPPCRRPAA